MEDEKIIGLLFERSERGLDELRTKYGPLLQKIAFDVLRSREDAEEVVNDALLGVWQTVPPEFPFSLSAYAAGITRKLALRRLRDGHAAKRGSALALEDLGDVLPQAETEEEVSDSRAITHAIEIFLGQLDEDGRNIFIRRYWGSESVATIAASLGMPRVSVSVRLNRMRIKLAEILKKEGITL